ncbi:MULTISPECIES: AbiH family protein [Acinetobacter]|jgi:hypothetical protein|uniref:Bacteriophage abortive infection AbiH n=1 Tax=Acinetobacter chengduensis TaxID=2420890 RepID=A0ABX9TV69_9GAMM|nr:MULTISPECIES: AbiH family protein [Acinetobacter]MBI1451806.1 hypothetical protein [Acinetobacter sp. FL51]RKG44140.1 hypothetical protein D7V31_02385 [Acinetobacter sp. WCHAc060007]RLL21476.1 hypothetical protein D9K81_09580 [Acinetobacter chengduensis]
MNILIVGNGFDLSHWLPTKYDHLMDVMSAIEKSKSDLMSFDELFSECREDRFIGKTKEYYLTDNIVIESEQLSHIRILLKENCWYQYFKNHVQEIRTWIDFEQKIESVLKLATKKVIEIESLENNEAIHIYLNGNNTSKALINAKDLKKLNFFEFSCKENMSIVRSRHLISGKPLQTSTDVFLNINKKFCYGGEVENGFDPSTFLDFLNNQLESFIVIFDLYLDLIIFQLAPAGTFDIKSKDWIEPDKIFSFNYTNTYQRIYDSIIVDYLHGSHGEFQNIVLGVSDLEDDNLKKLKAFGFTKYHQKLFKDTDYLFLDEFKNKIFNQREKILDATNRKKGEIRNAHLKIIETEILGLNKNNNLDLNFYIWGHSLDVSDKDYIIDLFSLNDDMDRNVRVTVYYFDKNAKFALLNNLLAILGKNKVEQWMKNKWLVFEPNPEVQFISQGNSGVNQAS